ncbi:MAG: peptidoglycan-binding protein, partial [Leptolyngbyaceae cyanobacterium SM2_3_12]|nr:peptidoglycan-binding protein [Leptolyngbyaceae cyanobacterium SM2_3_12]
MALVGVVAWGYSITGAITALEAVAQPADPTPEESSAPSASPTLTGGRIVRPTLQLGNQGESVQELQSVLMLLGYYPGPVSGIYQEATLTAVQRFQEAAGLTADGIVGPSHLETDCFPTPPSRSKAPPYG